MNKQDVRTGSCLCGGVAYEVRGPLRPVVACHCSQCRKLTGHHMAATATRIEHFSLTCDETLKWYASSDHAKRGFCNKCGSQLFWRANGAGQISITAGTLDDTSGLKIWGHIFASGKASYYEIPRDERQEDQKPGDFPVLAEPVIKNP